MEKLKVDSEAAYAWIEQLDPTTWIKAFLSEFPKCDMLLNNHSEVFNRYITFVASHFICFVYIRSFISLITYELCLIVCFSYILDAREMPFLSMLETIFAKIMQRTESKQRDVSKWTGRICPKIGKKLEKFIEWSNECGVKPGGNYKYSVSTHESEQIYNVDMQFRTCDCKRWQLTGIPCHHAIACCKKIELTLKI
jgi:hypothetical protein